MQLLGVVNNIKYISLKNLKHFCCPVEAQP